MGLVTEKPLILVSDSDIWNNDSVYAWNLAASSNKRGQNQFERSFMGLCAPQRCILDQNRSQNFRSASGLPIGVPQSQGSLNRAPVEGV